VPRIRWLAGLIQATLVLALITWSVRLLRTPPVVRAQAEASPAIHREPGYVAPQTCEPCHRKIWQTYQLTGMARSFHGPDISNTLAAGANTFYHRASGSHFDMLERGAEFFQRRYQLDSAGRQIDVMEKRIDFVMGSGNHSRAYLHRTERGTLVELPLAWYSEKGGSWAMNPGYDRPDNDGFRRAITYDCMFCHNGYPAIPATNQQPFAEPVYAGPLPQGIDCQRCHGPGANHVRLAKTMGARAEDIRKSVLNPSRLSPERRMEVCMQCHLETTSFPLPNAILRYERGPFSYRPGEPLADFMLFFDHEPGKGRDDKFELVSAAYRLRRSACFAQSNGRLTCTTCHNPHDIPRGASSSLARLVASGQHPSSENCIDCHMPKRRTEDVVHAVVTDHYIQRRKPGGDLLADLAERHEAPGVSWRGRVVPYYPNPLPRTPENQLDLAIAQVIQQSNLEEGIAQLAAAVERYSPRHPEYDLNMAEAWRDDGHLDKALPYYEKAVRLDPGFIFGLQELGTALRRSGRSPEAIGVLQQAASKAPDNPVTWREIGLTDQAQGKSADAIAAFEKTVRLDPDMAEAWNNMGVIRLGAGDRPRAEADLREAIRIQPDYADAHANLANLLSNAGDFTQASEHFETALRLRPHDAPTHYGYAMLLGRTRRFDEAQRQLEQSIKDDPRFADAHKLLGDLLMAKDQAQLAISHYHEALRIQPDFGGAQLGLASALLGAGDKEAALPWLQKAAANAEPAVRSEAVQLLRQLGR
jgi:tetratricopeptide (TPR) repeat protein/mono/diheme cytochrome c family protein